MSEIKLKPGISSEGPDFIEYQQIHRLVPFGLFDPVIPGTAIKCVDAIQLE